MRTRPEEMAHSGGVQSRAAQDGSHEHHAGRPDTTSAAGSPGDEAVLHQAVAKLNATGQRSGDLLPYAAESIRRAQLLDQVAEELRKRLRQ